MALIAEYEARASFARDALQEVPDVQLDHESITFTSGGTLRWAFWASGESLDAFEKSLEGDDTVEDVSLLTRIDGRRLYQATVKDPTGVDRYATMTDRGIQLLDVTITGNRTVHRVRCPSRQSYADLKRAWEAEGHTLVTRRLFTESSDVAGESVLTSKQREMLCLAVDRGYFRVPREVSLATLADELDLSGTAASQRIRRGLSALLTDVCYA